MYLDYQRARETSSVRIANMQSQFDRVAADCGFRKLSDLDGGKLTKWLLQREADEMSAATRNVRHVRELVLLGDEAATFRKSIRWSAEGEH